MSIPLLQIKQEPKIEDETSCQSIDQNLMENTLELNRHKVYVKSENPEIEIEIERNTSIITIKRERERVDTPIVTIKRDRDGVNSNLSDSDMSSESKSEAKDKTYAPTAQKRKRYRRKNKDDIVELIVDNDVYVCGICKKTFRIRGYAIRHIENHKKNGENERNFLEMHQKIEKNIPVELKPVKNEKLCCQRCDKSFKEHEYLLKHLRWNKCKGREDLLCKKCGTQFDSYTVYKTHLTSHEPKKNQCELCSEVFRFKNQLQNHYTAIHQNCKPYKCDFCGKAFAKRTQLSGHLISHSDTRPYACKKCGKRFKHKQNVKKHLETHNRVVNLTCKLCQKTFPRESRLKYHMRSHDKERPFLCDLCQKSFSHKNNVIRHLMYKHPHTLEPIFVEEFKAKLRKWAAKRLYSKHVMESLKYCIYKGNKSGEISSISSVQNFNSITMNQNSTGINPNSTDISHNSENSNLDCVKNELNSTIVESAILNDVSIKMEAIEPECILGAD